MEFERLIDRFLNLEDECVKFGEQEHGSLTEALNDRKLGCVRTHETYITHTYKFFFFKIMVCHVTHHDTVYIRLLKPQGAHLRVESGSPRETKL